MRLLISLTALLVISACTGDVGPTEPQGDTGPEDTKITPSNTATSIPPNSTTLDPVSTTKPVFDRNEIPTLKISPIPHNLPSYNRKTWRHWTDKDGDCQNTRHEVLLEESVKPVQFTNLKQCSVLTGSWIGQFTGTLFTTARDLDVDHMVPLANAHRSGGWAWDASTKKAYANDLSYTGHLIAVSASANRSKGDKGPEHWRPPDKTYWCNYARDWIHIKAAWELSATTAEWDALREMLDTCQESLTVADRSISINKSVIVQASPAAPTATLTPIPGLTKNAVIITESVCVDLNKASAEELQRIMHIGPSRATGVIAIRPISSIVDLDKVPGIGPSRLRDILAQDVACVR
ncbi:helix-hairpin-helix domain-containing protein [Dehalococcoidia bacterium]|nr:helix-hairpin-helix domain-containing protein [Dehalococcoidia bacterium]